MATTTVEKEILALEREYWDAMVRKDPDAPTRLTADECLVVGPPGISTVRGRDIAKMVTSHDGKIKKYDFSNVSCLQVDPNTAILAYSVTEEVEIDGQPMTVKANDATLWTKRNGQWVSAFHTESIAGDPWGRDKKKTS